MAGTITPVVYGPGRLSTWYKLIGVYTVSQIAGAALTGLILASAGCVLRSLLSWETASVVSGMTMLGVVGALQDAKLLSFRLPSRRWQVPQSWKRFPETVMVAGYGFGIGVGVLTRIPFASFYVVLLATLGIARISWGVALMVVYAATRAAVVAFVANGQLSAVDPHQRLDSFTRLTPLIGYLDGLCLALSSGFLLSTLVAPVLAF